MRTTLTIDDKLLAKAQQYTGIKETAAVVREALQTLVHVQAGRRLARLGGSDPQAKAPPRRRLSPR